MMTAQLQMKRMLDGLMGTNRNGEESAEKLSFTSSRVCKCYLLKCCPHDVLSATRCDLGQCPRVHNVALRADYELALKTKDHEFEIEVLEALRKFLSESERRSKVAKKRLKLTQEVINDEEAVRKEKIKNADERLKAALAKAEEVGATTDVEETMKLTQSIEDLKKEKADAETEYQNAMHASVLQQQKLRVCEVCSSYLGLEDNDRRLADHFNGRMHLGFLFLRNKVEELENQIQDKYIKKFLDHEFSTNKDLKEKSPSPPPSSPVRKHRSHRHKRHRSHSHSYSRSHHKRRHRHSSEEERCSDNKNDGAVETSEKKKESQQISHEVISAPAEITQSSDVPIHILESKSN